MIFEPRLPELIEDTTPSLSFASFYGLKYAGSKRMTAPYILEFFKKQYPEINKIYDPFCGGLGFSANALWFGYEVFSNDIDSKMIFFLKELQHKKSEDLKKIFRVISPFEFKKIKSKTKHTFEDVSFLLLFSYLGDIRKFFISNEKWDILKDRLEKVNVKNMRNRIFLNGCDYSGFFITAFDAIMRTRKILSEKRERITFSNLDYRKINYKKDSIIYLDPPYFKITKRYKSGRIKYQDFLDFVFDLKNRGFPVYISSYFLEEKYFKQVLSIRQRVNAGNLKIQEEKVFVPK